MKSKLKKKNKKEKERDKKKGIFEERRNDSGKINFKKIWNQLPQRTKKNNKWRTKLWEQSSLIN